MSSPAVAAISASIDAPVVSGGWITSRCHAHLGVAAGRLRSTVPGGVIVISRSLRAQPFECVGGLLGVSSQPYQPFPDRTARR